MRIAGLLFVTLLNIGCDGRAGAPPTTGPHPTPALALGGPGADGAWASFSDGQDVTLVAGAQGGFHVWMGYRLSDAPVGDCQLERTAHRLGDGALVLRTNGEVALAAGEDDQPPTLPMFMCPSPIGLSVIDQPIVFELRFSDAAGEIAHASVTLVSHCPDDAQGDFCRRICTG